jgi:hypothetical protein
MRQNHLEKRAEIGDDVVKGRFIRKVFTDTAADIDQAQRKLMDSRGFENNDWYSGRSFNVSDNALEETHLKKHRFVDMRNITSKKDGRHAKKNHPIYNRIIWGHYNNVIREMAFGFTEVVKQQLKAMED